MKIIDCKACTIRELCEGHDAEMRRYGFKEVTMHLFGPAGPGTASQKEYHRTVPVPRGWDGLPKGMMTERVSVYSLKNGKHWW